MAEVAVPMVVDGLDPGLLPKVEGLPAVKVFYHGPPALLEGSLLLGLQGELPPLALEHVDPAPSLKPGLAQPSHPRDPERW